jgi:hypothetical protein
VSEEDSLIVDKMEGGGTGIVQWHVRVKYKWPSTTLSCKVLINQMVMALLDI